jgi:hypothetical protein
MTGVERGDLLPNSLPGRYIVAFIYKDNKRPGRRPEFPGDAMRKERLVICDINEKESRADLILNRPDKKNALSMALLRELTDAITSLKDNDKIRCIVLSGAGDCFSSGRDLYDMRDSRRWGSLKSCVRRPRSPSRRCKGIAWAVGWF